MVIERKLDEKYKQEIRNHFDLTVDTMVKAYTLQQLSYMDGVDTRTVKHSGKYIPVRVEDRNRRYDQKIGKNTKGFSVRYIRVDEVKHIFGKRNHKKKLVEEYK